MPNGIAAYAAYVPGHRLTLAEIADALAAGGSQPGSRSVAAFDEDTTTMAVEAARRAVSKTSLIGADGGRGINGESPDVYFATTAPAYADKTNATAIRAALDLGRRGFAADLAGSARSSSAAMRAARASAGLAVMADLRTGLPGSADERSGGDGAAAFLFGPEDDAAAVIVAEAAASAEFLDRWRDPGATASSVWEERFGLEQYVPLVVDASERALAQAGITEPDHVLVSSPHPKVAAAALRRLRGRVAEVPLGVGWAGAADLGLRLAATLDRCRPGETILAVNATDGADATVLRVTERIEDRRQAVGIPAQVASARELRYATYLSWRGLLDRDVPRRPDPARPAGPPAARTEAWKFALVGSRSTSSGRIHLPPARVDLDTRDVDRMERVSLAGARGTVATFTVDRLAHSPSPPMIDVVVDFDGGGRYTFELADATPEDVEIGTRVEMTFRRLYTSGGVHNYFWKARALRESEPQENA